MEEALVFNCSGETLYGILHSPEAVACDIGVLIVVGGPQYRVGSHRQFVELARGVAAQRIPVMRFDCRGMGDSEGIFPGFENLDDDIKSAMEAFYRRIPELQKVVIWGLCDGASAASFYAPSDERVAGVCLANPWVRTEQGEAQAFLKHYYLSRLFSRSFWSKLMTGQLNLSASFGSLLENLRRSGSMRTEDENVRVKLASEKDRALPLPVRLFNDLMRFPGQLMFIISGNDLTAAEFMDATRKDKKRQKFMSAANVRVLKIEDADHTFSRKVWMEELIRETVQWVKAL